MSNTHRRYNGDTDRQNDRVLKRLMIEKPDRDDVQYGRVSSLHLSRDTGALQYCRCLNDLAKDGWLVKSELEYREGKKIGYFRLIGWSPVVSSGNTIATTNTITTSSTVTAQPVLFKNNGWRGDE